MSSVRFWTLQGAIAIICLYTLYHIFGGARGLLPILSADSMSMFKTLFVSIVLEALPFILLGVAVSALLQAFVSEETVRRFTPRNPVLGILFGCLLGILFPLCECGMIPIVRRLIRKGMQPYIGVVFILAGPILNPVVFASTYLAFRSQPEIAYARMALAFVVAFAVGLVIWRTVRSSPLRTETQPAAAACGCGHDHEHGHGHGHGQSRPTTGPRLTQLLSHGSDEFFEMGKYLIFGAVITALIQTGIDRETLFALGQGPIISYLFMMGFAFILSICSTSDAFVASSFTTTFAAGPLLAFLVYGPMLDLKNTAMLLSVFKTKFVLWLAMFVTVFTFVAVMLYGQIGTIIGGWNFG